MNEKSAVNNDNPQLGMPNKDFFSLVFILGRRNAVVTTKAPPRKSAAAQMNRSIEADCIEGPCDR